MLIGTRLQSIWVDWQVMFPIVSHRRPFDTNLTRMNMINHKQLMAYQLFLCCWCCSVEQDCLPVLPTVWFQINYSRLLNVDYTLSYLNFNFYRSVNRLEWPLHTFLSVLKPGIPFTRNCAIVCLSCDFARLSKVSFFASGHLWRCSCTTCNEYCFCSSSLVTSELLCEFRHPS